jgi:hypothetical protein
MRRWRARPRGVAGPLGPAAETPAYWAAIANDPSRPAAQRALAVELLVRRNVVPGRTTLGVLGAMLGGAAWLGDNDLELVEVLGGKVPVSWSLGDTVAAVSLPGGRSVLYLAVAGQYTAPELVNALRGTCADPRVLAAVIRDLGFSLGE